MYIKTFKFTVSNAASSAFTEDKEKPWYSKCMGELTTPEQIDKRINKYINTTIPDREVVDIKITPVDIHYHNNGRGNTIELVYTILYK